MTDEDIKLEIEIDRLRWSAAYDRAKEIVQDLGWTEDDEDYDNHVQEETKRQWEEDWERDKEKEMPQLMCEEESRDESK